MQCALRVLEVRLVGKWHSVVITDLGFGVRKVLFESFTTHLGSLFKLASSCEMEAMKLQRISCVNKEIACLIGWL